MKNFITLSETLGVWRDLQEDLHDKHNFTVAQHKKAQKYHQAMRAAHSHADDHDPSDTKHWKAAEVHATASVYHAEAADSLKRLKRASEKTHGKRSDEHRSEANYAHKESKKANALTPKAHAHADFNPTYRERFDSKMKQQGGAHNPYGKKK